MQMSEKTLQILRFLPVVVAITLLAFVGYYLLREEKHVLRFSTGSKLGLYHAMAKEMKASLEAKHPEIHIQLLTSAGSSENVNRIDEGAAELALVQNDASGGRAVRSVAGLYQEVLHLVCRNDSKIRSLADLKGKTIGIGAPGSGTEAISRALLEFSGVPSQGQFVKQLSFSEALDHLEVGTLDAGFFLTGLGAAVIPEAWRRGDMSLAAIAMKPGEGDESQSVAKAFSEGFRVHYPHIRAATIPMMAYAGRPKFPVPTMSVTAVLVCNENVDADIVEKVTRTLFEQRAVLSQRNSAFASLDEVAAQAGLQFPVHEGAEQFYRRSDPGFLASNAEAMGFILTLVLLVWSVVAWGQKVYAQGRKNRIDIYYKEVSDVNQRLNSITDLDNCNQCELTLNEIRQRASAELVDEQLAADDAYIIYQNMLNGCQEALARVRLRLEQN